MSWVANCLLTTQNHTKNKEKRLFNTKRKEIYNKNAKNILKKQGKDQPSFSCDSQDSRIHPSVNYGRESN